MYHYKVIIWGQFGNRESGSYRFSNLEEGSVLTATQLPSGFPVLLSFRKQMECRPPSQGGGGHPNDCMLAGAQDLGP